MEKTILVIGATGMLGEPVARRMKEDGFRVRVMTRGTDKARKLFDESFEIVVGDVRDTNNLEKSLNGCYGVHINLSGEIKQLGAESVASVASKKGLERITYISGTYPVEEYVQYFPPIKQELLAAKALQESGVSYSIFCPAWFMETLPKFVRGNRASIIGKQPNPLNWLAADDYARMVSASYRLTEAVNKDFFIRGPDNILMHEALKRYCSVFHPQIKKISTMPYWLVNFMATITRNKEMKFASNLMTFFEKFGEGGGDPTEANRILGAPRITLDEWLRQRKAKLGAPTVG